MARAIRERGDDIRDLYAPQITMPSYVPQQAPDASAKLERVLGTVGAVIKSPITGAILRGGQALKGMYDEAMVKAAADRRAARLAAGDGNAVIEGEDELTAPVDTSRQLTSFEERPAGMPAGQDFSRGLAAARGVQFMPAVGESGSVVAAAQRRFNEVGPRGEAPSIDPSGHRYAMSNKLADIQREGLEFEANNLRNSIANAPATKEQTDRLDVLERQLADMDQAPSKEESTYVRHAAQNSEKVQRPWNAAMDKWVAQHEGDSYVPPAEDRSLGMRLGGPATDRSTAVRSMTFGQEPLTTMPSNAGMAGVRRDRFLPTESTEPQVVEDKTDSQDTVPQPTPGMSGMSLRKAPVTLADATDEQLATVRSRLAPQADDPVVQARLAKIDAELKDRADRKTVDEGPISREEIMGRARNARTPEEQAQVLRDLARVQAPITSFEDLLSDHPQRVLQNEVVSLFPSAPKKSMEEMLAESEKDRAMAEYYRARGRGEDVRAPAEASKATAAAGKYGAQTKTIDAMRDPTVENLRAKTDALLAGRDKIRAQVEAIKARKAAGAYHGTGGSRLKDDLAYLKLLQEGQSKDVADAKIEFEKVDKAAADADKAASDAISNLRKIGNPGQRPADPPKNADEKLLVERSREIAAWELKKQAFEDAKAVAEQESARRETIRQQREEAKRAMQEAARAAEQKYNPVIGSVMGKVNKRLGVEQPGMAPAAQPAAPAPAPAAPKGFTVGGQVVPEGGTFENEGKVYQVVNGAPKRIK